ncbi:MAG: O-antigen polysaccharide polymerase Wzy [Candidatus Korobacteraceae bacterium]
MTASSQTFTGLAPVSLTIPPAAFEVLLYLAVVAAGTLCYLLGWLSINAAVVLGTALLVGLSVLAWYRFDAGRHPCFLFLGMLMLFQGGRLVAYCLGWLANPFQIEFMTANSFTISRNDAGLVLLLILASAICVYAPSRWNYRRILPPDDTKVRVYLPYLYCLLICSSPIQLFKNYQYFQYAQQHGGYLFLYVNHAAMAASVPLYVRAISLITFPAFVAIFVFERNKKLVWVTTVLYFGTSAVILLLGTRGATFTLAVTLWYVARMKSMARPRIVRLALLIVALMLVANIINLARSGSGAEDFSEVGPATFITQQGVSLAVTEVAVKYREVFHPHVISYLFHDLLAAFEVADASNFVVGKRFDADMAVFLNPQLYNVGYGSGGSYLAEAYVVGGFFGVVVISLLIGTGLQLLYTCSRTALGLFAVAIILPEVLWMSRGSLLGWASVMMRNSISIVLLALGWWLYTSLRPAHPVSWSTDNPVVSSKAGPPGGE